VPTYQYACVDCGEPLEVRQSFSDEPLTICPACEGRLRKVFNAVGVVFKGSGFYKTDSRRAAEASSNGESATKDKPSTNGAEKAAAAKPAADKVKSPAASPAA
jgi:putative FmdB family regulatory protein